MSPPGAPDPIYVGARRVLLDALQALGPHREAIVLVGAQAIYLHTGEGDLALAPYTTDADLALAPADVKETPRIDDLLVAAGFTRTDQPGSWRSHDLVVVDLMVPAALAGTGSRGARLGPHGKYAARKAKGLEAALIERAKLDVGALDPASIRQLLANPLSSAVTREALSMLRTLFGTPAATGSLMAARATEGLEEAATITASCAALASDLLAEFTPPS
jgi:hypothetical protein